MKSYHSYVIYSPQLEFRKFSKVVHYKNNCKIWRKNNFVPKTPFFRGKRRQMTKGNTQIGWQSSGPAMLHRLGTLMPTHSSKIMHLVDIQTMIQHKDQVFDYNYKNHDYRETASC